MCDTLCVLTDGATIFAKSSDRPAGEVQVVEAFPRRAPGGTLRTQHLTLIDHGAHAFVGGRPTWLWGVEHGVNEHRVAIGNERVWTVDDPDALPPALLGMDLVRLGLELGRDADEAIDRMTSLLEEHGQGGVGEAATGEAYFSSFLIADPSEAWILETSGRTWAAKPIDRRARGASLSNRLSMETEWTRASRNVPPGANFQRWRDLDEPTAHADQRLAITGAIARRDPAPSPNELRSVLRDHAGHEEIPEPKVRRDGTGVSICMHLRGWEATTGSMIAVLPEDPHRRTRAWMALGNPCVSVFVPVFPPFGVPAALTDERRWQGFERLKQRAEAARDGEPDRGLEVLRAIRRVLDPVEQRLWERAESVTEELERRSARADGDELRAHLDAFSAILDEGLNRALAEAEAN